MLWFLVRNDDIDISWDDLGNGMEWNEKIDLSASNVIQTFLGVSASVNNNNGQMDFIIISLLLGIIQIDTNIIIYIVHI